MVLLTAPSLTIGFGLPTAISAEVAGPHKTIVDVDSDAQFSMRAMEIATALQSGIGMKALVLNNKFQGIVLQWQGKVRVVLSFGQLHRHLLRLILRSVVLAKKNQPRFHPPRSVNWLACKLVQEHGRTVREEFLAYDRSRPVLMESLVKRHEYVFPMVRRPVPAIMLLMTS